MTGPLKHSRITLKLLSPKIYLVECRCGWAVHFGMASKADAAQLYREHKKEASK